MPSVFQFSVPFSANRRIIVSEPPRKAGMLHGSFTIYTESARHTCHCICKQLVCHVACRLAAARVCIRPVSGTDAGFFTAAHPVLIVRKPKKRISNPEPVHPFSYHGLLPAGAVLRQRAHPYKRPCAAASAAISARLQPHLCH